MHANMNLLFYIFCFRAAYVLYVWHAYRISKWWRGGAGVEAGAALR